MKKIYEIEMIAALVLLMVSIISFIPGGGITSYVSADTIKQEVDIVLTQSQTFRLSFDSEEPIHIRSFRITGEVLKQGYVQVFIDNLDGQRVLIYDNKQAPMGGLIPCPKSLSREKWPGGKF